MKTILCGLWLKILIGAPLAGAQSFLPTWPSTGGPVEGQVLNYDTEQPVAGAIVLAMWKGNLPGWQPRTICTHAETAISDAEGRYHITQWAAPSALSPLQLADPVLEAYKPGFDYAPSRWGYVGHADGSWNVYHRSDEPTKIPGTIVETFSNKESAKAATHPHDVYLKPSTGAPDQRFEYIQGNVFSGMNCGEADSSRNLYPLWKSAYQEAKPLAMTTEQIRTLSFMREDAVRAWLGLPRGVPSAQHPEIPDEVQKDLEQRAAGSNSNDRFEAGVWPLWVDLRR